MPKEKEYEERYGQKILTSVERRRIGEKQIQEVR